MKLYQRYIFWQIVLYTGLCLGVFVFVLVAGKVIRDGAELLLVGRVSFLMFLELFGLLTLYVFTYALPLSLLTAILLVLGRLSSQREITALKASGMSLFRISVPIMFIAILGTLCNIGINTYLAPMAKHTYKYRMANVVKEDPTGFIQKRSFIRDFPGYTLYLEDKVGEEMRGLWIWEHEGSEVTGLLKAEKGYFSYDEEGGYLRLRLLGGTAEKRAEGSEESPVMVVFDELPLKLPLALGKKVEDGVHNMHMLTVGQLVHLKEKYREEGDVVREMKVKVEMQKDFATAFSVFSLVALAIPLGIKASRKETYANLALAVLLAGAYYTLLIVTTWFDGHPQYRPDLLVWVPNLLFQGLGVWWLWEANQH